MAQPQVGWIGLGSMGIGMAKNLQKHLTSISAPALIYTNRTLSRGEPLKELGGIPVETVTEVAQKSTMIFSCVSNDAVLTATAKEIIASGDIKGKIYADCSTVHPDTSLAVSKLISAAGGEFVAGTLPLPISNPFTDKLHHSTRLRRLPNGRSRKANLRHRRPSTGPRKASTISKRRDGRSVISMGSEVSQASLLKIAGNICVVSFMEVLSEAHVFAEKTGLGSAILETMIGDMFGPVLESYSKRLTTGAYAPAPGGKAGFGVELAMKDARHALDCAEKAGTRLQVSEVALANMEKAAEFGEGRPLDSSAMYGTIRREAGLDFFTDLCKERDARK
ncbi:Glyoxylate/succinic semialdehyde reductase [Lachnellula suecica]|uniref:Glyoxylate/succinic semialdehyde reductase n=1 Tax=Lachnellula suecica TaxID=602035 RepID=A0A8T9CDM3_9HELO|nr:Glyoxylate/succinic semialdehyde reductase [Lachnellula suecica]